MNQDQNIADVVLDYLADQTYNKEPVLHAILACDFVSRKIRDALALYDYVVQLYRDGKYLQAVGRTGEIERVIVLGVHS